VSGQRHAPTALPSRKIRYRLYRRLGGSQDRSGRVRKISPQSGIRSPDRPARWSACRHVAKTGKAVLGDSDVYGTLISTLCEQKGKWQNKVALATVPTVPTEDIAPFTCTQFHLHPTDALLSLLSLLPCYLSRSCCVYFLSRPLLL
jgi:hypothetical protein